MSVHKFRHGIFLYSKTCDEIQMIFQTLYKLLGDLLRICINNYQIIPKMSIYLDTNECSLSLFLKQYKKATQYKSSGGI